MMATDQYAEFRAISDRLWQVPTGIDGKHRFLFIVKAWWQSDPQRVVMIVQAINTFRRGGVADHGDYALYIGSPIEGVIRLGDGDKAAYHRAQWVTELGSKLTANEQSGFAFLTTAPDGIELDWRP